MTDNEIIKVLEYCTTDGWCSNCPHENKCIEDEITQLALDLINRQKAEIERLNNTIYTFEKHFEFVKAEAFKEFAELLKEHIRDYHPYYYVIDEEAVDNLVEEMVGENNAPCN